MSELQARLAMLAGRVRSASSQVSLFPLVNRLERWLSLGVPIGGDEPAERERVHFTHAPDFNHAAAEVLDLTVTKESDGPSVTLRTTLLGLLGTESPLPELLSEKVLLGDDEGAQQAFFDVFQHRLLSLFYRLWRRYSVVHAFDGAGDEALSKRLQSFVGVDAFASAPARAVDPLFSLGLSDLSRCEPAFLDTAALEEMLRRLFPELGARVVPAEARPVRAEPDDMTLLGEAHSLLGIDYAYGDEALDPQGIVRIAIGPVSRAIYEELLPGGARNRALRPLLDEWLASRAKVELEIHLASTDAPSFTLGEASGEALASIVVSLTSVIAFSAFVCASRTTRTKRGPPTMRHEASFTGERNEVLALWAEVVSLLSRAGLPPAVVEALRIADGEVRVTARVDLAVDRVVVAIDEVIHAALDEVLHDSGFQALEAAWRGLDYAVEVASHHTNVKLTVWNWTKDDLARDLAESSELARTRTFAEVYTAGYGVFGGEPYAAILGLMDFGPDPADIAILRGIAGIAAMAHAPFFAAASPRLLQLESWRDLPTVTEVRGVFDAPRFLGWNALRSEPDARYLGLLLPRYLAREPYTSRDESAPFGYTERIGSQGAGLLWGSPTFPFAARLAATFARYGTLSALAGEDDDAAEVPVPFAFPSLGAAHVRAPVETAVTARVERMLRDAGFMCLVPTKGTTRLWLSSANSLQARSAVGASSGGRGAALNHLLGTQFPYLLLACRIAHYLKVIERDLLGASRTQIEIARELETWLAGLTNAMDAISAEERARYPLRDARVEVMPDEGSPGWLRAELQLSPQLRYLGSEFTLSLATRFEHRPR